MVSTFNCILIHVFFYDAGIPTISRAKLFFSNTLDILLLKKRFCDSGIVLADLKAEIISWVRVEWFISNYHKMRAFILTP